VRELETKMASAAEKEQFEIAQDIKETIKALNFYQENQSVEILSMKDIDI